MRGKLVSAPRLRATPLPGIGVQYDLVTREHRHLSVVAHRDGARTVNVYRADDPDSCAHSLRLAAAEAGALIDALKPSHHSANLLYTTDLGLVAERIEVGRHLPLERTAAGRDVHADGDRCLDRRRAAPGRGDSVAGTGLPAGGW